MKVLHFGRFHTQNFGGIERHVQLLLKQLGQTIHVDNLVAGKQLVHSVIQQDNYRVFTTPSLGLLARTAICPTMPYIVRKLQRLEGYDIAHLHFPDPMSHLAAYFLPRQVKRVITWHSDIIKQRKLLALYRPFLKHILNQADAIVAATPKHFTASQQLQQLVNHKRLYVIPFGIDYTPFNQPNSLRLGQAIKQQHPGKKLIFALGRHVYYKGFTYLLEAMRSLPTAVLLLGGSGPLTAELQQLARQLDIQARVVFLGRIHDEELAQYYHAADLFCMPSIEASEAFGLVQLEAMACKKPVVCCELNNGVTYVNQHGVTGLVVPPKDSAALATALRALCQNEAMCQQFGKAGYQRAIEEFSLEKMKQQTLDVYSQVLQAI